MALQFSQLPDALDREIYDADDPGDGAFNTLPGTSVRSEGGAATGDADADGAYDYSGDTYDYFFSEHGRDSYDGAGATVPSSVHFCPSAAECFYGNAFWNGTQMVFGEGASQADDVVAHELTHAVTEHSANLFYYMQSGALNESYSDIFGETVDLTNAAGDDSAGVRWQIGEDIPAVSPLPSPLRHMLNPALYGDPEKMSDAQFYCEDPGADNGGVHINSGVPNRAYALMVDGDGGLGITGLGLTKAGKIQYRALTQYLTSASDFLDNYNAVVQSCQDLIGTAGITAADCTEVGEALDAVEMSDTWPCPMPPNQAEVPALCPAGEAPDLFFTEDFESSGLAVCPSNSLPTEWCLNGPSSFLGSFATSGEKSAWGYDQPVAGMISSPAALVGLLPLNARMQFNHSYGFDNDMSTYWDGGLVEYRTNGGMWLDAGGLITDGATYGGTVNATCSNPLGGQSAFVADSWGYTATQIDLSSLLAGSSFEYRFTVGTDCIVDDFGWFVDDVRIYSCASCVTTRVLDATYNGLASFYGASVLIEAGAGFHVDVMESLTLEAPLVELHNDFVAHGDLTVSNAGCP